MSYLIALSLLAAPHTVAPPVDPSTIELQTVSDEELSQLRGGFSLEGLEINFGAEIRTFLQGELVLRTNISWGSSGVTRSEYVAGSLTPVDASQLQAGILSSGGIRMRVGDDSIFLANGGQTALLHRTDGTLQNILVNTSNNIDAVQEVDATLELQNGQAFQRDMFEARLGDALGSMVSQLGLSRTGD